METGDYASAFQGFRYGFGQRQSPMRPFMRSWSGDDVQQKLKVIGTARQRTALSHIRLTQGSRRAGDMAAQGQDIPAWFVPEYPAEVSGRADGTAQVRPHFQRRHARGQGSCRAPRSPQVCAARVVGLLVTPCSRL